MSVFPLDVRGHMGGMDRFKENDKGFTGVPFLIQIEVPLNVIELVEFSSDISWIYRSTRIVRLESFSIKHLQSKKDSIRMIP